VGGVAFGDLDSEHDRRLTYLSHANIVIVSVDFRLVPEHSDPAALDDCFYAWYWFIDQAGELGVDPARIGIVGRVRAVLWRRYSHCVVVTKELL
jgi:acetyl esterase